MPLRALLAGSLRDAGNFRRVLSRARVRLASNRETVKQRPRRGVSFNLAGRTPRFPELVRRGPQAAASPEPPVRTWSRELFSCPMRLRGTGRTQAAVRVSSPRGGPTAGLEAGTFWTKWPGGRPMTFVAVYAMDARGGLGATTPPPPHRHVPGGASPFRQTCHDSRAHPPSRPARYTPTMCWSPALTSEVSEGDVQITQFRIGRFGMNFADGAH